MSNKALKMTVLRLFLFLVISLTLGLSVYHWNAHKLVGTSLPMPFGIGSAVVLSGSMEPELSVNDLIIVRETGDYEQNDVIVFEDKSIMVVHRIIDINGDEIVTKGDANNVADEPITMNRIRGEVIAAIPGAGTIVEAIRSPIGILLILVISVILIELSYRKERNRGQKDIEDIKEEIRRLKKELE